MAAFWLKAEIDPTGPFTAANDPKEKSAPICTIPISYRDPRIWASR